MGLFGRNKQKQELEEQRRLEEAMHERAMRLVDTRGVIVRAAEAELQAAIAAVRGIDAGTRGAPRGGDARARRGQAQRRDDDRHGVRAERRVALGQLTGRPAVVPRSLAPTAAPACALTRSN